MITVRKFKGFMKMEPPYFGRSVNHISIRGGRLCPPNNTGTPRFSHLPTTTSPKSIFWTVPFPTGSLLDLSAIVKSKTELILKLWGIFGPHILDYICTFLSAFCFNRRLLKIRRFCSENGKTTWKVMHILEQLPLRAPSLIKHFKLNSLSVEIKYSGNVVFELGTPTNFHFL